MAHANQKHSNQSPSTAQLKSALALIATELARGPLRSSYLSKIMRDTFGGSDASGAWSWRMAYDMMQAAAVQTLHSDASGSDPLGAVKNLAMRLLTETRRSEQQIRLQQFSTPLPYAALAVRAAAIRKGETVLEPSAGTRAKMSERSPDYDVTAVNKSGRKVRIGTAWNETGNTSGNPYISMQLDVGLGPFRVNAVQTQEARKAKSEDFEIIPLVSNGAMKSGSISGELTAMDADNAFAGYIANMMFDLDFMLIENDYKTEETHPDYRIEVSSPKGKPIRVGSAWMAKSNRTGHDYVSLLINTPDGDLRVNAVQNEEQRGGQTFSIIPFVQSGDQQPDASGGLSLVA